MEDNSKSPLEDDIQTGSNNEADISQAANVSSDEEESFRTCDNAETGIVVNAPPEFSDDSDESESENSSDLFLSDNHEYDSDISNPAHEMEAEDDDRNVETSFQRELLDYLGSLFNVSSRIRTRDARQMVTVNEDQLEEYNKLREKVDKEMKILGVGSMTDVASTDQSVARNLYYLLSARERGDWSSCRQYMRVVPMWTFERSVSSDKNEEGGVGDDGASSSSYSSNTSEKIIGMEVEEESVGRGEELIVAKEEDKDYTSVDGRGIAEARCTAETGGLNRGAQLWAEDCDGEGASFNGGAPSALSVQHMDGGDEIANSAQLRKEVEEVNPNNRGAKLEDTRKESGLFKRSFQNCNETEEMENSVSADDHCCGKEGVLLDRDLCFKKCKLDTKEPDNAPEVTLGPSVSSVCRTGQRDIKAAIYGSRWSVRRLGLEARFPVHEGCVNALNFSSTGDWLASGSDDRQVVITDWQQRDQVARFAVGHSSNIFQVRFLPGSSDLELVTCSRDRSVRYAALSSTGQFQYSRLLAKHNDACHKMDMPLDQPCLVISAGEDCRVLWTDVRAQKNSGQLCLVDKVPLYSISCNPVRSQEFCVAGKDNRVYIYDRRNPKRALHKLCPEQLAEKPRTGFHVTSVVYSGDGNSVLASYNDEDIYLLSVRPGNSGPVTQHRYVGHRNVQTVTGVSFYGPAQEYVVSGSNDGHVLLWDRESEALINWFLADEAGVVNVLQPHPSQPVLATSGLDHDVKLWSMWAADCGRPRVITVDDDLIDRDQESSRIDQAWKRLEERRDKGSNVDQPKERHIDDEPHISLPFNLRNLQVITALNWKMRDESYPYSFDNTLDNLILMSRRHGDSNQLRNLFISDSDSNGSYENVDNIADESGGVVTGISAATTLLRPDIGAATNVRDLPPQSGAGEDTSTDGRGAGRPDGCRSS